MDWKNTTSYSRGDKERKPTTWTLHGNTGKRITITCNHIHYPGEWVMFCESVGIKEKQIFVDADNLEEAKAVTLVRVKEKIEELNAEWSQIEHAQTLKSLTNQH